MGYLQNLSDRKHTEAELVVHTRYARSFSRTQGDWDPEVDTDIPWAWSTGYRSVLKVDFMRDLLPPEN